MKTKNILNKTFKGGRKAGKQSSRKRLVNVMRKRFPFMNTWASNGAGFGHSRGNEVNK